MMVVAFFSWWYGAGWAGRTSRIGTRMQLALEMFSVSLLMRTLFDPFRQISAGQMSGGSFDARMHAFGDRLFSRVFGAVIRSLFILIGATYALLAGLFGLLELVAWPLLPLLPIVGLVLMLIGRPS